MNYVLSSLYEPKRELLLREVWKQQKSTSIWNQQEAMYKHFEFVMKAIGVWILQLKFISREMIQRKKKIKN